MSRCARLISLALLLGVSSAAVADLLIVDSYRNTIHRFSSADGALIQLDWLTDTEPAVMDKPIEVIPVGDELWVSDQNKDGIHRWTPGGDYLGMKLGPANQLDNVRGFHVQDGVIYMTNFGTLNGAPGAAIAKYDQETGALLGVIKPATIRSPWDIAALGGRVLVADDTAIATSPAANTGKIFELLGGSNYSVFASGSGASENGLSLPEQMTERSNGNLLVANKSTPYGLIELSPTGSFVRRFTFSDLRPNGVYELENGHFFFTAEAQSIVTTNGCYTLDPATGVVTPVIQGYSIPGGTIPQYVTYWIPEPATLALAALAGLLFARRMR